MFSSYSIGGFLRPSVACMGHRLLNVCCSFETINPVGVKDIKQAVSTPAYNTDDTNRNPVGVTGYTKKAAPFGTAFSSSDKPMA